MLALVLFLIGRTATPDRSGEPTLLAMLDAVGKLRDRQITVIRESRPRQDLPLYPIGTLELDLGDSGRFRAYGTGMWGEGLLVMSDGKTVLSDPLDDNQAATLRDAKPTLVEEAPELDVHGAFGTPLVVMLQGRKAEEKLLAKDASITLTGDELRWHSVELGNMAVRVDLGSKLPIEIRFDDIDHQKKDFAEHPDWFDFEPTTPLTRHSIYYGVLPDKGKRLFVLNVPKDPKPNDLRKKAP